MELILSGLYPASVGGTLRFQLRSSCKGMATGWTVEASSITSSRMLREGTRLEGTQGLHHCRIWLAGFLPGAWTEPFPDRTLCRHAHPSPQQEPVATDSFPPAFWLWFSSQIPRPRTWEGRRSSGSLLGSLPVADGASWTALGDKRAVTSLSGYAADPSLLHFPSLESCKTIRQNISCAQVTL